MIQLLVRGMSQDIDFETGDQTNFVLLEMPGKKLFRAAVEDDVAQMLMNVAAGLPPDANQVQQPQQEPQPGRMDEEERAQMAAAMERGQMQMSEDLDGQAILDFGGEAPVDVDTNIDLQKMPLEQLEKLPQEMVMKGKTINSGILDDMGNLRSIPGGGVDAGEVVSDDDDLTDSI